MDVTIEFPNMTDLLCEMADVFKKLEATKAELAAERAKPKGGVVWALRNKTHGGLFMEDGSTIAIFISMDSAEIRRREMSSPCKWEVNPYPIGDVADELKAAIERATERGQ